MKISVRKAEKIIKEYAVFAVLLILYGVPIPAPAEAEKNTKTAAC